MPKFQLLSIVSRSDPLSELDIVKNIGSGTYGEVFQAKVKATGDLAALKSIKIEATDDFDIVQQEIAILADCKHENIVGYYGSYYKSGKLWIAMEYCSGGSIQDIYQKHGALEECVISFVCRETLKGLEYLHRSSMMHRDIKGANLLLTNTGDVKLADFGISATLTITLKRKSFIGTPYWMAPEVAAVEKKGGYNTQCDIWAVGITAIEMAETQPPLFDLHPMTALYTMTKKNFKPEGLKDKRKWSKEFQEFIKHLLVKEPMKRPTATQALCHHFVYNQSVRRESVKPLLKYASMPKSKAPIVHDFSDDEEDEVLVKPIKIPDINIRNDKASPITITDNVIQNSEIKSKQINSSADEHLFIKRLPSHPNDDNFNEISAPGYIGSDLFAKVPNSKSEIFAYSSEISRPKYPSPSSDSHLPLHTSPTSLNGSGTCDDGMSNEIIYSDPAILPPRPPKPDSMRVDKYEQKNSSNIEPSMLGRPLPELPSSKITHSPIKHSNNVLMEPQYEDPDKVIPQNNNYTPRTHNSPSLPPRLPAPPLPPKTMIGKNLSITKSSKPSNVDRQSSKDMQACFSKIFHGCPLKVNSATNWIHPESKEKYVLVGSEEGLYSLLLSNRLDAEMEQMYPKKIWWLYIFKDVMLSIVSSQRYMCMTMLLNMYDKTFKSSNSEAKLSYSHTTKIKGSKGTLKCTVIHNPYTSEYFFCGISQKSIIILQWYEPRGVFMLNKQIDFEIPYEMDLCEGFVYQLKDRFPLPILVTAARDSGNKNVKFDTFDPNANENHFSSRTEYSRVKVTGLSQLEPDTVIVVYDNVAKFVNLQGMLKPSFGKYVNHLSFDFSPLGYVRLKESILVFHKHGMQAKSLADEEVTAEVYEETKIFRLIGADRNIIIESKQVINEHGPSNLYILAGK